MPVGALWDAGQRCKPRYRHPGLTVLRASWSLRLRAHGQTLLATIETSTLHRNLGALEEDLIRTGVREIMNCMTSVALDDLVGIDLLDELDALHRAQRETETRILRVATDFALEHGTETVDRARSLLPGRERAVRLGGQGTPKVAEFAPALVAGRLSLGVRRREAGRRRAGPALPAAGAPAKARRLRGPRGPCSSRRPRDAGADRGAGRVRRRPSRGVRGWARLVEPLRDVGRGGGHRERSRGGGRSRAPGGNRAVRQADAFH